MRMLSQTFTIVRAGTVAGRLPACGLRALMFLGDSITDLWNVEADPQGNPGGKRVFDKYFGDVKVANFGISGDTTQGVLWRLQNGESKGHKPKAVMLMLGTNNTGGASGAEIAEGLGAIVLQLRNDFPDAKIMAVYGEGPSTTGPQRRGMGSDVRSCTAEDFRFTRKGDIVYAFAMQWPENGKVTIKSIAAGSEHFPKQVAKVELLGAGNLAFTRDASGLVVTMPQEKPNDFAYALKVTPT